MKYPVAAYAQGFVGAVSSLKSSAARTKAVKKLVLIAVENGDGRHLPLIAEEAGRMLREKLGIRKVTLETARPMKNVRKQCGKLLRRSDVVEERVSPDLIAGIRIVIDDGIQFDGSMAGKMKKLFAD